MHAVAFRAFASLSFLSSPSRNSRFRASPSRDGAGFIFLSGAKSQRVLACDFVDRDIDLSLGVLPRRELKPSEEFFATRAYTRARAREWKHAKMMAAAARNTRRCVPGIRIHEWRTEHKPDTNAVSATRRGFVPRRRRRFSARDATIYEKSKRPFPSHVPGVIFTTLSREFHDQNCHILCLIKNPTAIPNNI